MRHKDIQGSIEFAKVLGFAELLLEPVEVGLVTV